MKNKTLIYITGPTAVGKSKLSISLAKKLKTEIISSDSRQFYKEMSIGTSVPSTYDLNEIKHYFIQHKSVLENYSLGDFEKDCIHKIKEKFNNHDYLIMTGGSGMYADSILFGLDKFPEIDKKIRIELNDAFNKKGIKYLQKMLKKNDSDYYLKVDLNNHQRIIRALEVSLFTNKPFSSFLGKKKINRSFKSKIVTLEKNRNDLYDTINKRVDLMIKNGLENEVKNLEKYRTKNSLQTVGYKEFFDFFDGNLSRNQTILKIKKNSRNYAKKQITWNKKYYDAIKISPEMPTNKILNLII